MLILILKEFTLEKYRQPRVFKTMTLNSKNLSFYGFRHIVVYSILPWSEDGGSNPKNIALFLFIFRNMQPQYNPWRPSQNLGAYL